MYLVAFFRRALWLRDQDSLPSVCFDQCNKAFTEAQMVGLSNELCSPDSLFLFYVTDCNKCVDDNKNSTLSPGLDPKLARFVFFCGSESEISSAIAPATVSPLNASAALLAASQRSSWASAASIYSAASVLGYLNATKTLLITVVPSSASFTSFTSPSATQTPAPKNSPATKPVSKAWVAGVVAGPILLIILAIGLWFLVKKRKLRQQQVAVATTPEKAQLHSDSVKKPTYELEGEGYLPVIAELPAKEAVGSELDAGKGVERCIE